MEAQPWYKITRPDWIVMDAFEAVWFQHGGPVRAALFGKRVGRTNEFYLTPESVEIAAVLIARFGGVPCDPPDLSNPTLFGPFLLVGDQSIIEGSD